MPLPCTGSLAAPYIPGGDGRLKQQHTIAKTHLQLQALTLVIFFFVRLRTLCRRASIREGLGCGRTDLGQPIAAARPDGVPPGRVGFRVFKSARRIVLRIALPASLLRRRVLRIALDAEGTRDVFVCQHTFWQLLWG